MSGTTRSVHGITTGRGPDSRAAIREAVVKLLGERGYDRMSMEEIATAAKSSKATIYRHWPDKRTLVAETIAERLRAGNLVPDTGSLRGDLMAVMTNACAAVTGPIGEIFGGVMTASLHDPQLRRVLSDEFLRAKAAKFHLIVERAKGRGEIPAGVAPEMLHQVMHCMISGRLLWGLGALDDEFVRYVVDEILMPMARNSRSDPAAR